MPGEQPEAKKKMQQKRTVKGRGRETGEKEESLGKKKGTQNVERFSRSAYCMQCNAILPYATKLISFNLLKNAASSALSNVGWAPLLSFPSVLVS